MQEAEKEEQIRHLVTFTTFSGQIVFDVLRRHQVPFRQEEDYVLFADGGSDGSPERYYWPENEFISLHTVTRLCRRYGRRHGFTEGSFHKAMHESMN